MSISITTKERFKTLNKERPLTSADLENMHNWGWALISSVSYQEGTVWRFIYYFRNTKLGIL